MSDEGLPDYSDAPRDASDAELLAEVTTNQMVLEDRITALSELLVERGILTADDILLRILDVTARREAGKQQ